MYVFFYFFSVKTDLLKDSAISRLYIAFASKGDTGNYTCSMRNAQASVFVHILDGKYLKACDLQKKYDFSYFARYTTNSKNNSDDILV